MRFVAHFIARLPFPIMYWLSDVLALLASLFYRRRLVTTNLTSCFPEKTSNEIKTIRNAFYRNLTDVSLEVFMTLRMRREDFEARVQIHQNEVFREIQSQKQPFLLYASHQCNWEWLGTAIGLKLAPLDPIYKEIRSIGTNQLMAEIRSKFGNRPLTAKAAGKAYRYQTEFRGGGIIADQSPTKKNKGKAWAMYLGKETPFYQGIFVLPYLTQIPAYYVTMRRVSRGYYEADLHRIANPPFNKGDHGVLKSYVEFSESAIRKHPSDWLWSHNRWKYPRTEKEELINFQEKQG